MGEALLSLKEAARFLKLHPNTVRALAKAGRIPAAKLGRGWRFIEADLVAAAREAYFRPARMQPSAFPKEAIWHSGNVQEPIISTSPLQTEVELDALLARTIERRRKSTTTG